MDLIQQISKGNYDQIHVGQGGRGLYTTKGRTLIDRATNEASSTGRSKVFFLWLDLYFTLILGPTRTSMENYFNKVNESGE